LHLQAVLTRLDDEKVGRQGFASEMEAAAAASRIAAARLTVASLSSKVHLTDCTTAAFPSKYMCPISLSATTTF